MGRKRIKHVTELKENRPFLIEKKREKTFERWLIIPEEIDFKIKMITHTGFCLNKTGIWEIGHENPNKLFSFTDFYDDLERGWIFTEITDEDFIKYKHDIFLGKL